MERPASNPPFVRRRLRIRKACIQCTRSKRKCDQSVPQCQRCAEKGDACEYQPFPPLGRNIPPAKSGGSSTSATETGPREGFGPGVNFHRPHSQSPLHTPPGSSTAAASDSPPESLSDFDLEPLPFDSWFLSADTWVQHHGLPSESLDIPVSEETLPNFIGKLQSWMRSWTAEGHSPLMHSQLYRGNLPECVQDAFTTLVAYHTATPATKSTVMRIVCDRAARVIQSQPQLNFVTDPALGEPRDSNNAPYIMLDTVSHLARTQALLVYQLIRLFDGDIRSRAKAEEDADTLHAWALQMFESARLDCAAAEFLKAAAADVGDQGFGGTNLINKNNDFAVALGGVSAADPRSAWRAWIIAESVRRTYLMAEYMQSVYMTMKRGWSVCPGGIAYTARAGLWDAQSHWTWLGLAQREAKTAGERRQGLLLTESLEVWKVLRDEKPGDVDRFTHAVMEISLGTDVVGQWMAGRESKGNRGALVQCQT